MTEFHLVRLAAILFLGILAEWVGWRYRLPSILLFFIFGFLAGPATGYLDPDVLFRELLSPMVGVAIAFLLFESSMKLSFSEIEKLGRALRGLSTIGVLLTWLGVSLTAYMLLDLDLPLALLLGATLTISGPTVITPLLREMPLRGQLGAFVRAEGEILEPVGVILATLVFAGVTSLVTSEALSSSMFSVIRALFYGVTIGTLFALLTVSLLRNRSVPDFLRQPFALLAAMGAFTIACLLQSEAGLLSVVVMGVLLANQKIIQVQPILDLQDTIRLPIIAALFIILSARLEITSLNELTTSGAAFLLTIVFVVRPLAVFASTFRSRLEMKERIFLAFFAPRGFVAAGAVSLFALELIDLGFPDAERLVPLCFLSIVGTVAIYGIASPIVARLLDVADPDPHGILILGGHDWARQIAGSLMRTGSRVLIVDTNHYNILAARREGLPARQGNIFLDHTLEEVVLDGFGKLLALTSNSEVNSLAALHFADLFGTDEVFQLAGAERPVARQILFGAQATYEMLDDMFAQGGVVHIARLGETLTESMFHDRFGENALLLFTVNRGGKILPSTADTPRQYAAGSQVICIVDREVADKAMAEQAPRVIPFEPKREK